LKGLQLLLEVNVLDVSIGWINKLSLKQLEQNKQFMGQVISSTYPVKNGSLHWTISSHLDFVHSSNHK